MAYALSFLQQIQIQKIKIQKKKTFNRIFRNEKWINSRLSFVFSLTIDIVTDQTAKI